MKRFRSLLSFFFSLCLFFAPLGICSWTMYNQEEQNQNLLEQEGILHDADVQKCSKALRGSGFTLFYQYQVETSNEVFEYKGKETVPSCDTYRAGEVIKIRYLASKPRLSTIEGNEQINIYRGWMSFTWYLFWYIFAPVVFMFFVDWHNQVTGKETRMELYVILFWGLLPFIFVCYIVIDSIF